MMRGRNGRDSIPNLEIRLCRKSREYRRKLKSKPQWRDPCEYKEITVLLSKIVTLTRRVFGETSKNVYDSLVASSHVFMDLALDKLKKKQYEQSFDIAKCGLKLIPASAYRDPDRRYDTILSRFHEVFAAYHFYRNALSACMVELDTCRALMASSQIDTARIMISKSAVLCRQGDAELASDLGWGAIHILEKERKQKKMIASASEDWFFKYDRKRTFAYVDPTILLASAYFNCASSYEMSQCHLDSLRLYRLALSCRNDHDVIEFQLPETLLLFRRKEPRCRSLSVQRWSWKEKFRLRREQFHSFKELTEISLRRVMKAIEEVESKEKNIDNQRAKVKMSAVNPASKKNKIEDGVKPAERRKNDARKKKPKSEKTEKKFKKTTKTILKKHEEPMRDEMDGLESIRLAASNIMKNQMQLVENIKRLGKCKSDSSKNIKKTKLDMVSSSPSSSHDIKTKITRRQERRPMTAKKTFGRTFSSASSARKLYGTPARTVKALRLVRTSGDASRRRPRRFEMGRNRAFLLLRRENEELLKCIHGSDSDDVV